MENSGIPTEKTSSVELQADFLELANHPVSEEEEEPNSTFTLLQTPKQPEMSSVTFYLLRCLDKPFPQIIC